MIVKNNGDAGAKDVLVVIGMHRSGTSATTGVLQLLGVRLGSRLYKGHSDINAKGYFEHGDVADTNDEILMAMGSSWDDPLLRDERGWSAPGIEKYVDKLRKIVRRDFLGDDLWALKDPRVCRLLPLWLPVFSSMGLSPKFLFVVRSPDAVYKSLNKRDGFSRDKSFLLWANHYLEAEFHSRGYRRAFITFETIIDDPVKSFEYVERALGIHFPVSPASAKESVNAFLSRDLLHHGGGAADRQLVSEIQALGYDVENRLVRLSLSAETSLFDADFDELRDRLAKIQAGFSPVLLEHIKDVGRQRGRVVLVMERVFRSFSWYFGKPMRVIERAFGRDV